MRSNILLQDGDTLFVPAAERFYVTGFVQHARFVRAEPNMTVQQAIARGRRSHRARLVPPA